MKSKLLSFASIGEKKNEYPEIWVIRKLENQIKGRGIGLNICGNIEQGKKLRKTIKVGLFLGAWREYSNSLIKKSEYIMNTKLAEIEADKQKFMMEMQAARGALEVHREVQSETKH